MIFSVSSCTFHVYTCTMVYMSTISCTQDLQSFPQKCFLLYFLLGIGFSLSDAYFFPFLKGARLCSLLPIVVVSVIPSAWKHRCFLIALPWPCISKKNQKKIWTCFSFFIPSCQLGLFQRPSHTSFLCLPFVMITDHKMLQCKTKEVKWKKLKIHLFQ